MNLSIIRNFCFIGAMGVMFSSCTPPLLYEEAIPDFKAPADKALCVVIRPSGMYSQYAPLWLDAKCVGGTEGNTITSFTVDPGSHLVMTKIKPYVENKTEFSGR
jgi:hypothetical protein